MLRELDARRACCFTCGSLGACLVVARSRKDEDRKDESRKDDSKEDDRKD
jgi:hypothetical protein